jgi:hypothetical protein
MKKILLTFSFTAITLIAFAQNWGGNDNNTITFGLMGGTSIAGFDVSSPHKGFVNPNELSPSSFGLNIDFKFNDYFSIRSGIFYAGKGGSMNPGYVDNNGNNVSLIDDYKLHYLELPLGFIGHLPVGDGANIFLGAGPYYSYGLNGTQTISSPDPVIRKITYGKNGDFKSTDFGATSVLGFQGAKGWSVSANLEFGLTNILQTNNTGFDATQFKTVTFYFSIGQSF